MYPELYRKSEYVKGSNESVPSPFRIGRILEIYVKKGIGAKPEAEDVYMKVAKFYRSVLGWGRENTTSVFQSC